MKNTFVVPRLADAVAPKLGTTGAKKKEKKSFQHSVQTHLKCIVLYNYVNRDKVQQLKISFMKPLYGTLTLLLNT